MPRLTVDPSGTHLCNDGKYFPLILDTAWSSFADPSEDDWRIYLATRRRQGFTGALVSILPILHDRDERPGAREPFALDGAGHYDFGRPDEAYFANARRFTQIAHEEYGLRLALVVLWNNYVPGTWGATLTPNAVMPDVSRQAYVQRVATTFADLEPIFVIGGDDNYRIPGANAAYSEALAQLRKTAPDCLYTTHSAPNAVLPDELLDGLDFFTHQSGHNVESQELTWRQPAQYVAYQPRKPVLAAEPPYEQHGKVGGHGRWSRAEVRRANWESVLAGATAGIGYGAHGMWMWHTPSGRFLARKSSLEPFPWTRALEFPGAYDVSLLARLFAQHRLDRLLPAQELLTDKAGEAFRLATSPDRELVVLYQPFARDVEVQLDLTGYRFSGWDLAERTPIAVDAVATAGGRTTFRQLDTLADQAIIAER
ncbi:apiosidase-like domain-containing protein [Flindersiella endophytica]